MNPRPLNDVFENEIYLHDGFTYDPSYGFNKGTNADKKHFHRYVVSIRDMYQINADTDLTMSQARTLMNIAIQLSAYIGGWKDNLGLKYYDISISTDSLEEANRIGKENNQLAIYDSLYGNSIYLNQ